MNNPLISIIVPIYNVEKYLQRCIESLLVQTYKNIEIILVNDGSTDSCADICNRYNIYDNIKVINKQNGGLSSARNKGIELSRGEFILFIDSDDWCEPNMVEMMTKKIIEDQSDISICGYKIEYSKSKFTIDKALNFKNESLNHLIPDIICQLDYQGMFNVVWNKMYKKQIILENNLFFELDGIPGEDLLFNCEYFRYIRKISIVKECLYYYMREDEDTLVTKTRSNLLPQIQRFNLARKELYSFHEMNNNEYQRVYQDTYIEYYLALIPNTFKNKNSSFNEKLSIIQTLLNNEEFITYLKNYIPKSQLETIMIKIINLKNKYIINICFSSLFFMKCIFPNIYLVSRKLLFLK